MGWARILVVDDDPHHLSSLQRILYRSGFEVLTADSGRHGLRLALETPPDLVLLDVSMPTMSGHEFLRRFRRLEARRRSSTGVPEPETPVIFVSALRAAHQRVRGLDIGGADYITKPFDAEELRARIRQRLRETAHKRQALAATRLEQIQLEAALDEWRQALEVCAEPLRELLRCFEQGGRAGPRQLSGETFDRGRAAAKLLARTLKRAAARCPGGGEAT